MQRYQNEDYGLPNNLNLLLVGANSAAIPTVIAPFLDNSFTTSNANFKLTASGTNAIWTASAIASANTSLGQANITTFAALSSAGPSTTNADGTFANALTNGVTFTPEATGIPIANANVFVTDTQGGVDYATNAGLYANSQTNSISGALNYAVPSGHALVVLGVGAANSAVGKTLASVPVHFGDKGNLQPTYTYSRFLAAVDVDITNGTAAKIVGIVHAPDTGDKWESLYSSISGFYGS